MVLLLAVLVFGMNIKIGLFCLKGLSDMEDVHCVLEVKSVTGSVGEILHDSDYKRPLELIASLGSPAISSCFSLLFRTLFQFSGTQMIRVRGNSVLDLTRGITVLRDAKV